LKDAHRHIERGPIEPFPVNAERTQVRQQPPLEAALIEEMSACHDKEMAVRFSCKHAEQHRVGWPTVIRRQEHTTPLPQRVNKMLDASALDFVNSERLAKIGRKHEVKHPAPKLTSARSDEFVGFVEENVLHQCPQRCQKRAL
jgi:hypothetical protein